MSTAKRPRSCLDLLSPTRQLLVLALKRRKRATADELAADCYLSVGAARQHLMALVMQNLLVYEEERRGPGRPRHVFALAPDGEALFPRRSDTLATAFLQALQEEDPEIRTRVLDRVAEIRRSAVASRLVGKADFERLEEFVTALEEFGYFPTLERRGREATLRFQHCPYLDVVVSHPEVCDSETRCMGSALEGFRMERIGRVIDGEDHCSFRLTATTSEAAKLADPPAAG